MTSDLIIEQEKLGFYRGYGPREVNHMLIEGLKTISIWAKQIDLDKF